jgi:1,4-dihydroxy-2-naphthoate octaprenyltransferase
VAVAIAMLYTLLAAFGISKALPSACIVSYCQLIILLPVEIYFFLQDSSCRITDPEHLPQPSLQLFQVLCALTLPVGKLVADYVLKNHEVNKLLLSPAVL